MTTYRNLQDAVLNTLHSQTLDQEERCALTADITSGATSFVVDDVTQVSRGLIEIDSELLWVKSVDRTNNTVTISPFGRGYGETTATSHTANTMVVNNPRFPRQAIKNALQDCLNGIYPEVYQVKKSETNTSVATTVTYAAPADCDMILRIEWQSIGPSQMWVPAKRWTLDPTADTTAFSTGKSVDIRDRMVPGRTVKITYIAAPGALSADGDTLASTGLSEGARDVLVFGACARLLQSIEVARLQSLAVEQTERAAITQPGAATAASRAFWQLYQVRLEDERTRLQRLYPTFTHNTR